jgi:hypothetical protein
MKTKIVISVLIFSIFCFSAHAKSVYQTFYDLGYKGGLAQGQSDRDNGYSYSPEVALNEFPTQMAIQALKEKIGHSEDEVDRGFRDGYFDGYKKGYYGR